MVYAPPYIRNELNNLDKFRVTIKETMTFATDIISQMELETYYKL